MLLQVGFDALALGCAYVLVALGFVLVLNAVGAVNFAHGDLVMAGGFLAVAAAQLWPAPGVLLLPAVLALMACLGAVLGAVAYMPLTRKPPVAVFVSTIAAGLMLQNGASWIFGAAPRAGPPLLSPGHANWMGVVLDRQSLAVVAMSIGLAALLWFVMRRTQLGRTLRATAEDREMAETLGIRTGAYVLGIFAVAAALAGVAGVLLAPRYFVTPVEGSALMLKAYIAVVIGGWGRWAGAVIGAVVVAFFEVLAAAWLSQPIAEAFLYAMVLAVLLVKPTGLMGEDQGRRA
ncbi:MAG: branched-chain amino acid ABC transporter permease [Alphaproteobacteria bacterium]|nr:branched-chain amino acid ABC transporter permease [Alphaproteobacteria bacterium]